MFYFKMSREIKRQRTKGQDDVLLNCLNGERWVALRIGKTTIASFEQIGSNWNRKLISVNILKINISGLFECMWSFAVKMSASQRGSRLFPTQHGNFGYDFIAGLADFSICQRTTIRREIDF